MYLYFVQVTGKGIAESNLPEPYGDVVIPIERYFRGPFIKLVWFRNVSRRQKEILSIVYPYLYPTKLTWIAIYSWIIIFTILCFIKPEFRTISDVQVQGTNIHKELYWILFFTVKRNDFIWRAFPCPVKENWNWILSSSNSKLTIEAQVISILFSLF